MRNNLIGVGLGLLLLVGVPAIVRGRKLRFGSPPVVELPPSGGGATYPPVGDEVYPPVGGGGVPAQDVFVADFSGSSVYLTINYGGRNYVNDMSVSNEAAIITLSGTDGKLIISSRGVDSVLLELSVSGSVVSSAVLNFSNRTLV